MSRRRAALPEILLAPDLALATGLSQADAVATARAGGFGPHFFIKGEVAVLRQDLLDALRRRAKSADPVIKEVGSMPRLSVLRRKEESDGR